MIPFVWGEKTATNLLLKEFDVIFQSYDEYQHEIGELEVIS